MRGITPPQRDRCSPSPQAPPTALVLAENQGRQAGVQVRWLLADVLAPLGPQGEEITAQILELVENVKGSVLGGLGLAIFLYTAISTVPSTRDTWPSEATQNRMAVAPSRAAPCR